MRFFLALLIPPPSILHIHLQIYVRVRFFCGFPPNLGVQTLIRACGAQRDYIMMACSDSDVQIPYHCRFWRVALLSGFQQKNAHKGTVLISSWRGKGWIRINLAAVMFALRFRTYHWLLLRQRRRLRPIWCVFYWWRFERVCGLKQYYYDDLIDCPSDVN